MREQNGKILIYRLPLEVIGEHYPHLMILKGLGCRFLIGDTLQFAIDGLDLKYPTQWLSNSQRANGQRIGSI